MSKLENFVFATGDYEATISVVAMPSDQVMKLIPDNVVLDPAQPLAPPGQHPVMFFFGHHHNVTPVILPFVHVSYDETLVAIPYVKPRGACGTGVRATTVFYELNKLLPTIAGWPWGFPKLWRRINRRVLDYHVRSLILGIPLIDEEHLLTGEQRPALQTPNFLKLVPCFEQHFLQRYFMIGPSCVSKMNFLLQQGMLAPSATTITVHRTLSPVFAGTYKVGSIEQSPLGAFHLTVPWQLGLPLPCSLVS